MHVRRKNIRLHGYDYSYPGIYFVTICTANRERLFGTIHAGRMCLNDSGKIVSGTWKKLPQRFPCVALDAFVVMPNHVHGIVLLHRRRSNTQTGAASSAPTQPAALGDILRTFKSESAIRVNAILKRTARPIWQRNYFEYIIRSTSSLDKIRLYIRDNPSHWDSDPDNTGIRRSSFDEFPWFS